MYDLISRQAAIFGLMKEATADGAYGYIDTKTACDVIKELPTAEPSHDGFLEFLFNVINPNEMEQYMAMYNCKKGVKVNG